jgi:cysteinyl-tRNA synthetase
MTVAQLAARQIDQFQDEWHALNVRPADVHPRATQEIPKMIEVIQGLIDKDLAYPAGGDVYFRVDRQPDYGKLSRRNLDDMIAGRRIEANSQKQHPMDFTLWKAAKEGEPAWDSPWGQGRPGWHIECSAMALRYLGEQIDVHGGGMDLIFPHHENEIAQSEAFSGRIPFVRHWMHNAMMQLGTEKMSKSLGNIITLRDGLDRYGADAIRLFVLGGQYRSPLTYSEDSLAASARGAERLRAAAVLLPDEADGAIDTAAYRDRFIAAMDDDLGTAQALASLFDLSREINRVRDSGQPAAAAVTLLRELGGVLGLTFHRKERQSDAAPFVQLLVEVRDTLRDKKEYALGDQIRDTLSGLGIALEDSRDGTTWRTTSPGTTRREPRDPSDPPSELDDPSDNKTASILRF